MRLRTLVFAAGSLFLALPAFPQGNPTGTVSGRVTDPDGLPLPGVSVTVESPQLQGRRTATSSANGDYIFPLLPPGDYTVAFEISGFQKVRQQVRVAAAQSAAVDAALKVASMSEEITVTAEAPPFKQDAGVASSYKIDLIEKLPIGRTLAAFAQLTPGVQATGPQGGFSFSGSMSFENLFLINGVVVNENIRGQAFNLFIEDALQEATTSVGAISAEYGRFGGGVVNAITKSGGNEFSGSMRVTLNNDKWRSVTPFPNDTRNDDVIPTWEGTLGGPIFRDRLWFFGAGRMVKNPISSSTSITNLPFLNTIDEKRYEGKLTFSLNSHNTVRASYTRINSAETNNFFGSIMDFNSLVNRTTPQDLLSVNYTGILTSNFFVEAQFSQRHFTFKNSGSQFTDLIKGTLLLDAQRGNTRYWSPTFCGVCDDEKRDNQNVLLKASYFLSTRGMGSHNVVFGLDTFNDERFANNHQSGSDYRITTTTSIIQGDKIFPVMNNDTTTFITWNPIFVGSEGTNFRTNSLFLNDTWRFNDRLTFNVGLRYDKNDGKDSAGTVVTKDDNLSPRLAMTFDPRGDGGWTLNASYAKYVAGLANSVGDGASAGGQPASISFNYRGPAINVNPNAPLIPTEQALQIVWDWFAANGGTGGTLRGAPTLPGINTSIGDRLVSPNVNEFTLGVSHRFGPRLSARLDGVYRNFNDFYATRVDASTGQVTDARLANFGLTPSGRRFDLRKIENTNNVDRKYRGLNLQVSARPTDRINTGLTYTLSKIHGNFNGETGPNGPVTASPVFYPEYFDASWNLPEGDLIIDARHKLNAWAVWDAPLPKAIGTVSLSVLQRFNSGTPYGAQGTVDTRPFVTNPGYATPPATVDYWFTARDAFHTDDAWRTDLSINWSRKLVGRGQLFLQAHVLNVFNGQALSNFTDAGCGTGGCINTAVQTRVNNTRFTAFNPFTTQPVQGTNWDLGTEFGQPLRRFAYQLPRTFRLSMGIRF